MSAPAPDRPRVALVTGAGSGIGAAVAAALAGEGWRVILCGRTRARLDAVAATLAVPAHVLPVDLTDAAAVAAVPGALPQAFRAPALLVNCAGHDVGGRRSFEEGSADAWAAILEANLVGLVRLTHALVPGMIAAGGGDVVNIGSLAALRPAPRMAAYVASKAGVHAFSDVLRADLARHGIRVMEVMPGLTRTGFAETRLHGDADAARQFYDKAPATLAADDVARAVLYAVAQPRHVVVAQLVLMPSGQW